MPEKILDTSVIFVRFGPVGNEFQGDANVEAGARRPTPLPKAVAKDIRFLGERMASPQTRDFMAWLDKLPGGGHQLIVAGDVETRSLADRPRLLLDQSDGQRAKALTLNLKIQNNGSIERQSLEYRPVRFGFGIG